MSTFWTNIMDEHSRFIAHLFDPDEYELIEKAMSASRVFSDLHQGRLWRSRRGGVSRPAAVANSLIDNRNQRSSECG